MCLGSLNLLVSGSLTTLEEDTRYLAWHLIRRWTQPLLMVKAFIPQHFVLPKSSHFILHRVLVWREKQIMFVHFTDEETEVKKVLIICSRLTQLISGSSGILTHLWICISFLMGGNSTYGSTVLPLTSWMTSCLSFSLPQSQSPNLWKGHNNNTLLSSPKGPL